MTPTVTKLRDGSYRVDGWEGSYHSAIVTRDGVALGGERFPLSGHAAAIVLAQIATAYVMGTVQYEVTEAPEPPDLGISGNGTDYDTGWDHGWSAGWLEGRTHG